MEDIEKLDKILEDIEFNLFLIDKKFSEFKDKEIIGYLNDNKRFAFGIPDYHDIFLYKIGKGIRLQIQDIQFKPLELKPPNGEIHFTGTELVEMLNIYCKVRFIKFYLINYNRKEFPQIQRDYFPKIIFKSLKMNNLVQDYLKLKKYIRF